MTRSAILPELLDLLACPVCAGPIDPVSPMTVGCFAGHRFDRSRHGYLTLLGARSRTDTGDDAPMVAARKRFLDTGHYRPIVDAVTAAAVGDGPVLELGSGTGHYLGAVLDAHADRVGIALDSSKAAAREAVGVHPRLLSVVADAWARLPVRDSAIATVLCVFAPREPAEIIRILEPAGRAVVVTPEPAHLSEVRDALGMLQVDDGKAERLAAVPGWAVTDALPVRFAFELTADAAADLVRMGPAARHHTPEQTAAAVADLLGPGQALTVHGAVTVSVLTAL